MGNAVLYYPRNTNEPSRFSVTLICIRMSASKIISKAALWLWGHPLWLVLLAHTVFSLGIWNARDGYGEETTNFASAFAGIRTHQPSSSIYVNLIALSLRLVSPDPVKVATLTKYLSSLLATVAVYLTLSCFSGLFRKAALIFACFAWIASSLNAPFVQSTSLSLFTFAVMLLGCYALLRKETWAAFVGFYACGLLAASMRPEYWLPVTAVSAAIAVRLIRVISARIVPGGIARLWFSACMIAAALAMSLVVLLHLPTTLAEKIDRYALFTFGQCYADFYHHKHPQEAFSPMTEYQALLDRQFNTPGSFWGAIKNNPVEASSYFAQNTCQNILRMPKALLRFHEHKWTNDRAGRMTWFLEAIS
jgi:hypothetical protein